ncbi:MAG TPA: hypothetical protein VMV33_14940 [Rhodocyclaceae bacterium]|nr:hypothetical protein [Rhodocyclaceae bacterium]
MITLGTGTVGYDVQTAANAQHDLIVDQQVTSVGSEPSQLAEMTQRARTAGQTSRGRR